MVIDNQLSSSPSKELTCGHVFHRVCVHQWFLQSRQNSQILTCPNCRKIHVERTIIRFPFQNVIQHILLQIPQVQDGLIEATESIPFQSRIQFSALQRRRKLRE